MTERRGIIRLLLGGLVMLVAGMGIGYFLGYDHGFEKATPKQDYEVVFCTQDALECPDGSYVGRVGPKCEFAPCPGPTVVYF